MSGASTAFQGGYISDRERELAKRRDLDLSELIELCSQPVSQEDRIAAVLRYTQSYPELRYFFVVAYFYKDSFKELMANGSIDYVPSKIRKGQSSENLRSTWKQVCRLYDSFPLGPRAKRGVARMLLEELHPDDAKIIYDLFAGTFYRKEVNEDVIAKAFPKDLPPDPKA